MTLYKYKFTLCFIYSLYIHIDSYLLILFSRRERHYLMPLGSEITIIIIFHDSDASNICRTVRSLVQNSQRLYSYTRQTGINIDSLRILCNFDNI